MTIQTNSVSSTLMNSMNGTTSAASSTQDTQNRFLKLLVSQMQNQDPLNPLDNAQVTSQLAQLSTVTGIDQLNTTLQSMVTGMQSSQSLQAASMIGHGVLVPGNGIQLAGGQAVLGVETTVPADDVKAVIHDASGKTVRTIDLGAQDVGVIPVAWDGKTDNGTAVADGRYTLEVVASRGGQSVAANPLAFGMVNSVSTGAAGVRLNLPQLGSVGLADVRQIL